MISLWQKLLSISFASVLALRTPSDPLDALPSLINNTNSSIRLAYHNIDWFCQRYAEPSHDFGSSCIDAVRQMAFVPGSVTRQVSWGPRGRTNYDVYLPQRVYSCMSFRFYPIFF